jgi:uncharacterized beta-barrel protein YwiB (DUF1934 family)
MRNVVVKVVGIQTDGYGEESRIELVTVGASHEKDGVRYISYRESELSGMEGTTTLLKVFGDHIALIRMRAVEQKQEFYLGKKSFSTYVTPFGNMKMSVFTKRLDIQFDNCPSSINVAYELEINGQWQSSNTLSVSIREEE